MADLAVTDLPGVGYRLARLLDEKGVRLVRQLRDQPLRTLQQWCGPKTGHQLYQHARGLDNRAVKVVQVRVAAWARS